MDAQGFLGQTLGNTDRNGLQLVRSAQDLSLDTETHSQREEPRRRAARSPLSGAQDPGAVSEPRPRQWVWGCLIQPSPQAP